MKIRFKLNSVDFEIEFSEVEELIQFIYNLSHNNSGKITVISLNMNEIVCIV